MELRRATSDDHWHIEALYDLCFAPGRTALSSYRLRDGVDCVDALSLVAEDAGIIGGAIKFWPVRVGVSQALLLGPIAVHPTHQGEGLGGALIREGLARALALGSSRVILVGDAPYYAKFGFAPMRDVTMPPPTNPDRVLGYGDWAGIAGMVTKS